MGKTKRRLEWAFYGTFSLCFIWIWVHIAVRGYYNYREVWLLLAAACSLALLLALWRTVKRHEAFLDVHSRTVTAVFLAWMFVWQTLLSALVRYEPVFDVDAVFGGAIEWAETGSFRSYYEYYLYLYNNFGAMYLLHFVFRAAAALGLEDWYMTASVFNGLLSLVTMYATARAGRLLTGPKGQFMLYAMFLVSPPFYFIAPCFYTDALSMPFVALTFWLYLLARRRKVRWQRLALYGLMGLTVSVGFQIRATAIIMFFAVVIDAVFTWDWRRTLAMSGAVLLIVLGGYIQVRHVMYQHLDREQAAVKNTPVLHTVMMGLKGNGMYNAEDFRFTRSFDDVQERDAALKEQIADRVRELGPSGMVRLLTTKMEICFGDGTYGLSDCLGGTEVRATALRQFLVKDERYFSWYQLGCTGLLLAVYVLMIASGLREVFGAGRRKRPAPVLAPRVAVFGLMLFLLCWEARWRYVFSFVPMIFLCALLGAERTSRTVSRAGRRLAAAWCGGK